MARVTASQDRARARGGLVWIGCLQFFLVERIAILLWQGTYSPTRNFISDLGAGCPLAGVSGCAGWPALMNGDFVLQGLLIGLGAVLLWAQAEDGAERLGLIFAGLAGLALILVGLAPEDTAPLVHHDAAGAHFLALSLSAFCFTTGLARRGAGALPFARISLIVAHVGLVGTLLLSMNMDFGLGPGSVERAVAYGFTIWLAALGLGFRSGRIGPPTHFPKKEPAHG